MLDPTGILALLDECERSLSTLPTLGEATLASEAIRLAREAIRLTLAVPLTPGHASYAAHSLALDARGRAHDAAKLAESGAARRIRHRCDAALSWCDAVSDLAFGEWFNALCARTEAA